jgi:hypothetical protein
MNRRIWLVGYVIAALFVAVGCGSPATAAPGEKAAQVIHVDGSDVSRVVLTEQGASRIGLKTEPVREVAQSIKVPGPPTQYRIVPVAALVYDKNGGTWVFATVAPLTYERKRLTVVRIEGAGVIVQSGMSLGTEVVTVGTAELLGAEFGVDGR